MNGIKVLVIPTGLTGGHVPKKPAKRPEQKKPTPSQLLSQLRELEEDLEREKSYSTDLRTEIRKYEEADGEKVLMLQRATRDKLEAESRMDELQTARTRLETERTQYQLTCMVIAAIWIDQIDDMTLVQQIKLLMETAEFMGVNPLELGIAPQEALAAAYSVVIYKRTEEFIKNAIASPIAAP